MQVLDLSALKPGSILPTPVYDASNPALLLLGVGTLLTEQSLIRLRSRGIERVIVDAAHAEEIAPGSAEKSEPAEKPQRKVTSAEIRNAGTKPLNAWMGAPKLAAPSEEQSKRFEANRVAQVKELKATMDQVNQGLSGKTEALRGVAVDSCEMMLEDLDLYVKMAITCQDDTDTVSQSLRTAQLAMAIAAVLGKSCENISDLGIGCLVARVGQTEEVKHLVQSPRQLTDLEWWEVKKMPIRTFDILEKCPDVPVGAKQVAYQMFERWDGSGYPRGRAGTQIHPLSRIASVADAYVALTSSRPHRPPFPPYRAVEIILKETRQGVYDPQAIRGLLQTVCLYPVGSSVRLSDNSQAMVLRTKSQAYDRPIVQIVKGPDGCYLESTVIDLAEREELSIVDVIETCESSSRQ